MKLITNLEWRYATKQFDSSKKISAINLKELKKSIQLAPSSYGLQLYKVLIIEDDSLKELLKPYSWNQNQITDCSHLLVLCNYTELNDTHIDDFIDLKAKNEQKDIKNLEGYGDFIKEKLALKSENEKYSWLRNQTYLALGFLLSACAELKIDACPMEGFEPEYYNKILNLNSKGLNACVIVSVGYRNENDNTQHIRKIRKPLDSLFEEVKNEPDAAYQLRA